MEKFFAAFRSLFARKEIIFAWGGSHGGVTSWRTKITKLPPSARFKVGDKRNTQEKHETMKNLWPGRGFYPQNFYCRLHLTEVLALIFFSFNSKKLTEKSLRKHPHALLLFSNTSANESSCDSFQFDFCLFVEIIKCGVIFSLFIWNHLRF